MLIRAYEIASLVILPYREKFSLVRTHFAVTLCARYNTENTWSFTQLPPFLCAISARFEFHIPAVAIIFFGAWSHSSSCHTSRSLGLSMNNKISISISMYNTYPRRFWHSHFSYTHMSMLGLINRFNPAVLTVSYRYYLDKQ